MTRGPSNYFILRNEYFWTIARLGECLLGSDAVSMNVIAPHGNLRRYCDETWGCRVGRHVRMGSRQYAAWRRKRSAFWSLNICVSNGCGRHLSLLLAALGNVRRGIFNFLLGCRKRASLRARKIISGVGHCLCPYLGAVC